jgi:hypothetical protein
MFKCAICGYEQSGSHNCTRVLADRIAKLEAAATANQYAVPKPTFVLGPRTLDHISTTALAASGSFTEATIRETSRLIAEWLRQHTWCSAYELATRVERGDWGRE